MILRLTVKPRPRPTLRVVKNGAGAMFDFGCYGANLMTWLMGNQRPLAVTAIAQTEKPGIQWSWDIRADLNADRRNDWLQMAEIAVSCGLEAGYFWKKFPDAPHVQNRYGLTLAEIKEIYRTSHSLKAVWSELKTA